MPLAIGGAIRLALVQSSAEHVFVLNGDTFLELDYCAMMRAHLKAAVSLTVAIRSVPDAGRYGALDVCGGRIQGFLEKGRSGPGAINGGTCVIERDLFERFSLPDAFSFEADLRMKDVERTQALGIRDAWRVHRHRRTRGLRARRRCPKRQRRAASAGQCRRT